MIILAFLFSFRGEDERFRVANQTHTAIQPHVTDGSTVHRQGTIGIRLHCIAVLQREVVIGGKHLDLRFRTAGRLHRTFGEHELPEATALGIDGQMGGRPLECACQHGTDAAIGPTPGSPYDIAVFVVLANVLHDIDGFGSIQRLHDDAKTLQPSLQALCLHELLLGDLRGFGSCLGTIHRSLCGSFRIAGLNRLTGFPRCDGGILRGTVDDVELES
mmetsp:Transcript_24229/g.67521  ORF Transcript_24229/g.67521 Transcript_24229/m.67521 type:complete len:217 (-) Transcript_24229:134-784(-)